MLKTWLNKYIGTAHNRWSKILPAISFLIILSACTEPQSNSVQRTYEHIDFTSTIKKEDCCLCGNRTDTDLAPYWGQDNVGIINVNTFEVMAVKINAYDWDGNQIKEAQGVAIMGGGYLGESLIHTFTDPDRGYFHITVYNEERTIDPEAIGAFLCQDCLDAFASRYFEDETPAEIAVVNFAAREIRPLVESCPWFTFDNFAVACDFQEDETISLLIYYCPPRFQTEHSEIS